MVNYDRRPDEETPLLHKKYRTPVPWSQLSLIFLALVAEPIASLYILPFINQLISELGITNGDDRKIGYYAGLIESLFFATQALTTWQWSRLSDFVGRRPVILVGLLGLSLSNIAFGLSRTFTTLVISRCIAGVLNGNVGVMKSMVADITDSTNMAQAFAIIPCIFSIGATVAPLYGGTFANPQMRWPYIFRGAFWAAYPYFLPCFLSGCFTLLTFLICAALMKESLPSKEGSPRSDCLTAANSPDDPPAIHDGPIPMSVLLRTSSVMIPIANYGTLALIQIGFLVLLPLFYSSPIDMGGLGFPPSVIGIFLAVYGLVNGTVQALFAARLIERVGARTVFCSAIVWIYPLILLFPVMSAVVTAQRGIGPVIWILIFLQLIFMVIMDFNYTVIFIFVTRAAPNKQSLGTTNGLSQCLTSVARALGPALTTSLFAFSKQYNIMGGNLVYFILAVLTTILVMLSRRLPDLKA